MATLAQIFDRFYKPAPGLANGEPDAPDYSEAFRLRMFPNEDVYFFVKKIDNSGVVRQSDPRTRRACWRVIGASVAVAVFLSGLLLPSVQGLMAGYRIETLRAEKRQLENERSLLEVREAKLLTTDRLQHLADTQQFVDSANLHKTVYLDASPDGVLARANQPAAVAAPVEAKQ
jgi:hypothetical protein